MALELDVNFNSTLPVVKRDKELEGLNTYILVRIWLLPFFGWNVIKNFSYFQKHSKCTSDVLVKIIIIILVIIIITIITIVICGSRTSFLLDSWMRTNQNK